MSTKSEERGPDPTTSPRAQAKPRPLIASGRATQDVAQPEHQETDVWYGGYAGRTMLPSFLVCILLTITAVVFLCVYWESIPAHLSAVVLLAAGGLIGAAWLFQLVRWLFRLIALNSRLTTRRLFYHRGFLYPDWDVVSLSRVTRAEARANVLERLLGVGCVILLGDLHRDANAKPLAVLEGIVKPASIAELIQQHAAKATEAMPTSA